MSSYHDGLHPVPDDAAQAPETAYSDLPEVAPEQRAVMDYDGNGLVVIADEEAKGGPTLTTTEPLKGRICGLRRKIFFIVLAVVFVLVAGAVAGGVAGGLSAKNGNSSSEGSADSDSDSTSSGVAPGPTGTIQDSERRMAASVSSDANVQLFYQDIDTPDILYRVVSDDDAADEKTVSLDIEPRRGTSLASASLNGSDPVEARLFYLAHGEPDTVIVQATLRCDADACETTSNYVISSNTSESLHELSKLSALWLGDDFVRVYWQAEGGDIWVLTGDDTEEWGETKVAEGAYPETGIVSVAPDEKNIHLFFVGNETKELRYMDYSDIMGGKRDKPIKGSYGTAWSPTASLAGVYVPDSDPYRLYYARVDGGDIVSFWQPSGRDNSWIANHNNDWGRVDGGFAAAAWQDQVRMYYFEGGELTVSAQDDGQWAAAMPL